MWTSQDAVYLGENGSKEVERRKLMTSRDTVVVASSPAHSVICLHALSKSDRLHIHTFSLC